MRACMVSNFEYVLVLFIRFRTFRYIFVLFRTFQYVSVHFGTFPYISVHTYIAKTNLKWIQKLFGTFWYISVRLRTLKYISVHFSTFAYLGRPKQIVKVRECTEMYRKVQNRTEQYAKCYFSFSIRDQILFFCKYVLI